MSWHGYVPREIWEKFEQFESMHPVMETYGMLRKHEPGEAALLSLFHRIQDLQIKILELNGVIAHRDAYITSLEDTLKRTISNGGR